ncbi:MAG TPA: hypothetical protein VNS79_00955 [Sphingobium sp.]|nr:hypothetical protein [Sphingobium sp.]
MRVPHSRRFFLALAGVALVGVLLANAHLVYVATRSQPPCVPHARAGDAAPSAPSFSAAKPSC